MKIRFLPMTALLIVLALAFISCDGNNTVYVHDPITNTDLSVYIGIKPTGGFQNGLYEYDAFLFWNNYGSSQTDGEFNDALILIDGIAMRNVGTDFFRINSGDGLYLKVGDTFEVVVKHSLLGTMVKTVTVPDNISTFTTDPVLVSGVDNVATSYTQSWNAHSCDEYSIKMERGTASDTFSSYSRNVTGTSNTWDSDYYFEEEGVFVTRIRYSLMAANKAAFENLASNAKVYVTSPVPATLSNY